MIQKLVHVLAACPALFDGLRWVLEGGFKGHVDIIRKYIHPVQGPVLDMGCGTGIYARYFDPKDYVGIDINPEYIRAAISKFPQYRFLVMDATKLDFPGSHFQAIFVSGVFHHLDDLTSGAVLKELSRVLQPQGKLVVWEDIPSPQVLNWIGHGVHALDEGKFIRREAGYESLFSESFKIAQSQSMRSGFMDYAVFLLHKK